MNMFSMRLLQANHLLAAPNLRDLAKILRRADIPFKEQGGALVYTSLDSDDPAEDAQDAVDALAKAGYLFKAPKGVFLKRKFSLKSKDGLTFQRDGQKLSIF